MNKKALYEYLKEIIKLHSEGMLSDESMITAIKLAALTFPNGNTSREVSSWGVKECSTWFKTLSQEFEKENQMIRRFTEADWNGFAGAEKFNDGSNPFIAVFERNNTGVVILGDVNGIEVNLYSNIEDDSCGGMNWQKCWNEGNNTPEEIKSLMEKLISDLGLDGDWYAPNVSYALDHHWDWGFEYVGEI